MLMINYNKIKCLEYELECKLRMNHYYSGFMLTSCKAARCNTISEGLQSAWKWLS